MTEEERRKIMMTSSTQQQVQQPAQNQPPGYLALLPKASPYFQAPEGSRAEYVGQRVREEPYEATKRMFEAQQVLQDTGYNVNEAAFNIPKYDATRSGLAAGATGAGSSVDQYYGGAQKGLISQLQNRAAGLAPSAAELQMQRGMQQGMAQNFALANSGRGNSTALARQALRQNAAMQGDVMGQAGVLRAQEQAAAEQALGGQIGQGRGQAVDEQQMVNQLIQYYTSAGMNLDQAQMAAQVELEKMKQGGSLQRQSIGAGLAPASHSTPGLMQTVVGPVLGAAAGVGAAFAGKA